MHGILLATCNGRCDVMDNDMGGGWWWAMGIGWLVFLGLIVLVVVLFVRQANDRRQPNGVRTAHDVLADRFARGEIDEDEYRRRRDALHG